MVKLSAWWIFSALTKVFCFTIEVSVTFSCYIKNCCKIFRIYSLWLKNILPSEILQLILIAKYYIIDLKFVILTLLLDGCLNSSISFLVHFITSNSSKKALWVYRRAKKTKILFSALVKMEYLEDQKFIENLTPFL